MELRYVGETFKIKGSEVSALKQLATQKYKCLWKYVIDIDLYRYTSKELQRVNLLGNDGMKSTPVIQMILIYHAYMITLFLSS